MYLINLILFFFFFFWYASLESTKKITSKDKYVKEETGQTCKDECSVTVKTDEDQ